MARPKKTEPKTPEEIRRNRCARNKRFREKHRDRLLIQRRKYYQDHKEELKFKDKLRKCGISTKVLKDEQKNTIP